MPQLEINYYRSDCIDGKKYKQNDNFVEAINHKQNDLNEINSPENINLICLDKGISFNIFF